MTPEHFLFIPTVFFLGFFLGGIFSQRIDQRKLLGQKKELPNEAELESVSTFTSAYSLGLSFFIFLGIFIATHALPFFGGAKALRLALNGKPLFDQRPVFSSHELYQRLNDYGDFGREMYQRFTYSADVIFPLSFLAFLFLLIQFVGARTTLSKLSLKRLMLLPAIWFASDMIENSIVFTLIAQFPSRNEFLSSILGFVTITKFGLMLFSIMLPAIISVLFRKKNFIRPLLMQSRNYFL